ncbi:MAG: hypothetical protein IPN87_17870 [Saprospiraceae bacterium]|nr:hypothetical protein [Candidatus Brachybacter algidus]
MARSEISEPEEDETEAKPAETGKKEAQVPEVSKASGKIIRKKDGTGTVSTTSGSVKVEKVAEVSKASGKIVRNKEGVKVVSTASGSVKRTKKSAVAATPNPTIPPSDTEPEFNGLKFSVDCSGVKAVGDNFELGIGIPFHLVLGDTREKEQIKMYQPVPSTQKAGLAWFLNEILSKNLFQRT